MRTDKGIEHLSKSVWSEGVSHVDVCMSAPQLKFMPLKGRNKLLNVFDLFSPPLRALHNRGPKYFNCFESDFAGNQDNHEYLFQVPKTHIQLITSWDSSTNPFWQKWFPNYST